MRFKLMFLGTVAVLSIGQNVNAQHCSAEAGLTCSEKYSKLDAFKILNSMENKPKDTRDNLELIERAVARKGLTLTSSVDAFVSIQRALGGSGATRDAQIGFEVVTRFSSDDSSLNIWTDVFIDIVRIENKANDAVDNFVLIAETSRSFGIDVSLVSGSFSKLLSELGGGSATVDAQEAFVEITKNLGNYSIDELTDTYVVLTRAENKAKDTLENFRLVLKAAAIYGSIDVAAKDFLEVLRSVGGASATREAQQSYRAIYGI